MECCLMKQRRRASAKGTNWRSHALPHRGILVRPSSAGQGTRPDIIGHNRAFVIYLPVRRGVQWHKARPVLRSGAWIRGRRLLPSSDGMRGLSGDGRRKAPCRCIAFPEPPRDVSSPMRVSWTCGSALPRPCGPRLWGRSRKSGRHKSARTNQPAFQSFNNVGLLVLLLVI